MGCFVLCKRGVIITPLSLYLLSYVPPSKIGQLVSMLSAEGRPHGYGGCGGFLWESQYARGRQHGVQFLLRCPTYSSAFKSLPHLSTAATATRQEPPFGRLLACMAPAGAHRAGRSSRHRRRSHRSPVAFIYISSFLRHPLAPSLRGLARRES